MLGQATGIWTHLTHHGLDSREATTFPLIVFSTALRQGYIQMALFPGTPKLESRNCPETVPVGVPGLWELITPDHRVGLRRGLNQSCSPRWDLSNDMLHSQIECREGVDSRLLVVGSQTASLTPGPSFALELQMSKWPMRGHFRYLRFKTFPMTQERFNANSSGPCCRTLNIRESRRTPSPQLWHPHTWPKWGCDSCDESCKSVFAHGSSMHQKCSNYALTNLLFRLYRSVWIIDPLVIRLNFHLGIPTHLSTPEVLWAKERGPIPYPFVIFTLDSHLNLSRSLRVHHCNSWEKNWNHAT
jgi:hypothetical protein